MQAHIIRAQDDPGMADLERRQVHRWAAVKVDAPVVSERHAAGKRQPVRDTSLHEPAVTVLGHRDEQVTVPAQGDREPRQCH
jgi:hypothetical protein